MADCKLGLGECIQRLCILEDCVKIREYVAVRQQEYDFGMFWKMIE